MKTNTKDRDTVILASLGLLFAFIILSPILHSGFISDDAINSFVSGTIAYNHTTLTQWIIDNIEGWLLNQGRIFPLCLAFLYSFFAFVNGNLLLYKSIAMLSVIINIFLFSYMVKLLTNSSSIAALSILLMPIFLQLRDYADPIMSFSLLMQMMLFYIIGSAILTIIYIKNGRKVYLAISLLLYSFSLLTYEITYVFFMFQFFIIYSQSRNINCAIKLSSPFLSLSIIGVLSVALLRLSHSIPFTNQNYTSAYMVNLALLPYAYTLIKQTTAAIPLTFPLLYSHNLKGWISIFTSIIFISYFIAYLVLSKKIINEISNKQINFDVRYLSMVGVALWILPSVIMASSHKFQSGITWGIAYLPVYISYFGLAIIFICIIYKLYNRHNSQLISIILAIMLSTTCVLTYTNNVNMIEKANSYWLYPRTEIENGLQNGLFDAVPDDSVLLIDNGYVWDLPGFYQMYSGVHLRYVGDGKGYNFSSSDNVFHLKYSDKNIELNRL